MEEEDEFGELYTDVLQPISGSAAPPPPSASSPRGRSDLIPSTTEADSDASNGDGFLFGASPPDPLVERRSTSDQAVVPDTAVAEGDGEEDWMLGRAAPAVDPPENWDDGDDQPASSEPAVADAPDVSREGVPRVFENDEEEARVSDIRDGDGGIGESEVLGAQEDDEFPLSGGVVGKNSGNLDLAPLIPGLSAGPASTGPFLDMDSEEIKASQSDDCDSDSDDDLHIVLNDSNHGPPGAEGDNMIGIDDDDDDDGEEDLVIVTDEDQHHHLPTMEDQDWTEEAMQPTGDGERKEMTDTTKMTGSTATGTRLGYSNHGFHAQHHSMYKVGS